MAITNDTDTLTRGLMEVTVANTAVNFTSNNESGHSDHPHVYPFMVSQPVFIAFFDLVFLFDK